MDFQIGQVQRFLQVELALGQVDDRIFAGGGDQHLLVVGGDLVPICRAELGFLLFLEVVQDELGLVVLGAVADVIDLILHRRQVAVG